MLNELIAVTITAETVFHSLHPRTPFGNLEKTRVFQPCCLLVPVLVVSAFKIVGLQVEWKVFGPGKGRGHVSFRTLRVQSGS